MRTPGARIRVALLVAILGLGGGAKGAAQEIELPFLCQEELMIFESLRYGAFDYCRLHLRYRPGAADCLRILLPTCNVFQAEELRRPFGGRAGRILRGHGERIICPPGPPPPSCPAGFPAGPIPDP